MVWLRFIADMDWKPKESVTLGYRVGDVANVTRGCAAKALREKKAVRMVKRSRHVDPMEASHDQ
jgi:hypothetical protein